MELPPKAFARTTILMLKLLFPYGKIDCGSDVLGFLIMVMLSFGYLLYVKIRTQDTSIIQGLKASIVLYTAAAVSMAFAPTVGIGVMLSGPPLDSLKQMLLNMLIVLTLYIPLDFILLNIVTTLIAKPIVNSITQKTLDAKLSA
jgi:hypothetical protein